MITPNMLYTSKAVKTKKANKKNTALQLATEQDVTLADIASGNMTAEQAEFEAFRAWKASQKAGKATMVTPKAEAVTPTLSIPKANPLVKAKKSFASSGKAKKEYAKKEIDTPHTAPQLWALKQAIYAKIKAGIIDASKLECKEVKGTMYPTCSEFDGLSYNEMFDQIQAVNAM